MKHTIAIILATVLCLTLLVGCKEEVHTLTSQEAIGIALTDAGYEITEVVGVHAHEGEQQGGLVYQVHFSVGTTQYTYLIDGLNGQILAKN